MKKKVMIFFAIAMAFVPAVKIEAAVGTAPAGQGSGLLEGGSLDAMTASGEDGTAEQWPSPYVYALAGTHDFRLGDMANTIEPYYVDENGDEWMHDSESEEDRYYRVFGWSYDQEAKLYYPVVGWIYDPGDNSYHQAVDMSKKAHEGDRLDLGMTNTGPDPSPVVQGSDSSLYAADRTDSNGNRQLFDPEEDKYLPVCDKTEEIKAITEKNGPDRRFEKLFEKKRRTGAGTAGRKSLPKSLGYGVSYTKNCQEAFQTGTSLYYHAICPKTLGGGVEGYVCLSGTNRAAKGAEVLVAYHGQGEPELKIYDWARPKTERWQVSVHYADLQNYLLEKKVDGKASRCIAVQNRTVKTGPGKWQNLVWLKNGKTGEFDLVYTYAYAAKLAEQRDTGHGAFGPCVEAFQGLGKKRTNIIGFSGIYLRSKDTGYSKPGWGSCKRLTKKLGFACKGKIGFELAFKKSNDTFGVH